ncbi:hypothetical protein DL771_010221 [Monosporascus sp. 5C6A]|nr:hypothetical protein DL771_010221 [Monosporascus sp. 5C6A]
MYATWHPDYVTKPWRVYIMYIGVLWISTLFVIFANQLMPYTQNAGMLFVRVGRIVTIIVIMAMPPADASHYFVWVSFREDNWTGWQGGVAFLLGVLNGALTVGTLDAITHIAE